MLLMQHCDCMFTLIDTNYITITIAWQVGK